MIKSRLAQSVEQHFTNKNKKMSSFKSYENIHKKENGSYYVGLYTTKMKAEQTVILCPERSKCAPALSVRESLVTFH